MNFSLVGIGRVLHAADHLGLESLPFLEQFFEALGIGFFRSGQSLKIAGLSGRFVTQARFLGGSCRTPNAGAKRRSLAARRYLPADNSCLAYRLFGGLRFRARRFGA